MMTLYFSPGACSLASHIGLEEVGAPYKTVVLGYGTSMKDASYLAINPMGKVPAIKHGDTIITEVAAICTYLADEFPAAKLNVPIGSPSMTGDCIPAFRRSARRCSTTVIRWLPR